MQASSPENALELSPSRKAVLDRFHSINKGPPPLQQSKRANHVAASMSPLVHAKLRKATELDTSMSLNLSQRAPDTSVADFDILGGADDTLLADAKQLGDDSFDRRLMKRHQAGQSSPSKPSTAAAMPATTMKRPRPSDSSPANSPGERGRSVSTSSDTSNLLDEQGEQTLLYASIRGQESPFKARAVASSPAKGSNSGVDAKGAASTRSIPRPSLAMGTPRREAPSTPATAARRPTSIGPGARSTMSRPSAPASASSKLGSAVGARPQSSIVPPTATPSARSRPSVAPIAETPTKVGTTPHIGAATAATTPRSRPPLNASAARMRRLSGLPQMVKDEPSAARRTPQRSSVAPTNVGTGESAGTSSTTTPQRSRPSMASATSEARRKRPQSMLVSRPSMLAKPSPPRNVGTSCSTAATPSSSSTARRPSALPTSSAVKPTVSTPRARPQSTVAGGPLATPSSSSSPMASKTGQLQRRPAPPSTPMMSPPLSAASTTGESQHPSALPMPSTSARKPYRPFLLGWGANHGVRGSSTGGASSGMMSDGSPEKSAYDDAARRFKSSTSSTSSSSSAAGASRLPRSSMMPFSPPPPASTGPENSDREVISRPSGPAPSSGTLSSSVTKRTSSFKYRKADAE
ncbi:unnamed protein product [Jaminaea pallidilutea]